MPFNKADFNKEDMRVRFWTLKDAVDAAKEAIVPLRVKRDAYVNKYSDPAGDAEHMAPILEIGEDIGIEGEETSLFDAEQEMAMISRFLGGQVGERPGG